MSARCFPTEERGKVVGALMALMPDAVVEGEDPIVAESENTDAFAEQLAKQRIRAAARKVLLRNIDGDEVRFRLNKQVATTGKISLSEEDHALGDIEVAIESSDIRALIDRIAPSMRKQEGRV
jgi:predicted RNA binding protein with dsRBD fold (UPF0201 family)